MRPAYMTQSVSQVPGHDAEGVGDEDDGGAQAVGEVLHEVEDLGLDGHVEGAGGLVGDEDLGVAGEAHGDHHALAHAAGELVRILVDALLGAGDARELEHLDGLLLGRLLVEPLVEHDGLDHLGRDAEEGIQGGHRILEEKMIFREVLRTLPDILSDFLWGC